MDAYEIGARIRAARLRSGVEQVQLAAAIGKTPATISGYERGKYEIKATDLVRIARLLSVPVGYLMGETELYELGGDPDVEIARRLAAMEPSAIGERIRQARTKAGLTQADVAEKCRVSASLVSKWERGDRLPSGETTLAMCRTLGANPYELLSGVSHGTAQPEAIAESVACLELALASGADIAPVTKGGLKQILSAIRSGGAVGWDDPVKWWIEHLRIVERLS